MSEKSILLIYDNEEAGQIIRSKLVLLRNVDEIFSATYETTIQALQKQSPAMIILHSDTNEQSLLETIKTIKDSRNCEKIPILVIFDSISEDTLLQCFDLGIDDYCTTKTSDAQIVMKILWALKKSNLIGELNDKINILDELNVIQKETGIYNYEYGNKVIKNRVEKANSDADDSVLMLISADINYKNKLSPSLLASVIKKSIRSSDIASYWDENRFALVLPKTTLDGAETVFEKIKKNLGTNYTISAGACSTNFKSFEETEKNALNKLIEALEIQNSIVILETEEKTEPMNWLDKVNSSNKNFKLFKQAFLRKLENVITPTFYQMQKIWEEKLFETKIKQVSTETQSSFVLTKNNDEATFKITYPGLAKINIDKVIGTESERISLDLSELDDSKLGKLLEDFIKEFQTQTDK